MTFFPRQYTSPGVRDKLAGWLASLTLEDEERPDLDLPRVVCEYVDVFPDELPGTTSTEGCRLRYRVTPWYFAHLYDPT